MLTTDNRRLLEVLTKMCPKGKNLDSFATHLDVYLNKYDITSHKRIAMFLAHAMHECAKFTVFEENLNYTAEGLNKIWPNRFPPDVAKQYEKQKEKIANRAYADRMGNGNEASGDGWKFRGRGIFQLTGKDNYARFDKVVTEADLLKEPDNVALPKYAVWSACDFWKNNNLNEPADKADVKAATRKINGGETGLTERAELYVRLLAM